MHKPQKQVNNFSLMTQQYHQHTPGIPPEDIIKLRKKLIREEQDELFEALDQKNLPEAADALADLLYVVYGTASALGINMEPVFDEVHRANIQKREGPIREDGKQLKPKNWQPPQIKPILKEQTQP